MLDHNFRLFTDLAAELAEAFAEARIDYVAGDAIEGYNSGHDLCRLLIAAALERSRCRSYRRLTNYDFPLIGPPDECPVSARAQAAWLRLDRAALARKLAAALGYREIAGEVREALRSYGPDAFSTECLRPKSVRSLADLLPPG